MSFNAKAVFFSLLILSIFGCTDFLKGKKKEDEVLKLKNDRFECLAQAPESIRNVFSESSSADNIQTSLICIENSLSYFIRRTKGNVPDGYLVQDIRSFFGKYLGDRDRVSSEMADELMKIKSALFGGTAQVITKKELQDLIDTLALIRLEIEGLKPYWNLLVLKDIKNPKQSDLSEGFQRLKESLTKLVLKTKLVQSEYSFSDFKSFLIEAEKFVKTAPGKSSSNFLKWMPLAESIKNHLFTNSAEMGSNSRWKSAVSRSLELYRFYSIYKYRFKNNDFYSREAMAAGDELVVILIQLLEKSWWMETDGIPFPETYRFFQALEAQNMLPGKSTAKSVFSAYEHFIQDIFDREEYEVKSLLPRHISFIKNEYRGFKAIQSFNDSMPDTFSYKDLINKLDGIKKVSVANFADSSDDLLKKSWRDWQIHLRQKHPLLYLNSGKLVLDRDSQNSTDWSWRALTELNVMKLLTRMLMLGFGTTRTLDLDKEILNEESMKGFYSAFWDFGVDIKAFDRRGGNSGKRTFFEADHFVYSGNGDGQVKLQEAFELINIIFSAGLSGLNEVQKDLIVSGCSMAQKDYFDNPFLEENCFKNTLRSKFGIYFKNLPGLKKWVATLSDKEWDAFYTELIGFSRLDEATVGQIETGDLRTMMVIAHYVESLFIEFDIDGDEKLSVSELVQSSKRFTPFFKQVFQLSPKGPFFRQTQDQVIDFAVSKGFACMVITGEIPSITSCTPAFIKEALFMKPYSNRTLILKTLNAFKAVIK